MNHPTSTTIPSIRETGSPSLSQPFETSNLHEKRGQHHVRQNDNREGAIKQPATCTSQLSWEHTWFITRTPDRSSDQCPSVDCTKYRLYASSTTSSIITKCDGRRSTVRLKNKISVCNDAMTAGEPHLNPTRHRIMNPPSTSRTLLECSSMLVSSRCTSFSSHPILVSIASTFLRNTSLTSIACASCFRPSSSSVHQGTVFIRDAGRISFGCCEALLAGNKLGPNVGQLLREILLLFSHASSLARRIHEIRTHLVLTPSGSSNGEPKSSTR
jgi:hypothetical protein